MLAGGFLMYTGIGGPIGLGLIGAGLDAIVQKATTGSVNWTQTALTAVAGGVGGGLAAARLGALGVKGAQATLAVSAASGAAGGGAGNAYAYPTSPGPHTTGEFVAATADGAFAGAALGAAGGALGTGLSRAASSGRALLARKADALTPESTPTQEPLSAVTPVPNEYLNLASPARTRHILDGDPGENSGGHRWPGGEGKSLFPRDWSDEKIMHEISDIATDPSLEWKYTKGLPGSDFTKKGGLSRANIEGERDGIKIRVGVEPAGEGIVTGFPVE